MSITITDFMHNPEYSDWTVTLDTTEKVDVYVDGSLYLRETTSPIFLLASQYQPVIEIKLSTDSLYSIKKSMCINNKSFSFRGDVDAFTYNIYRLTNDAYTFIGSIAESSKGYYTFTDTSLKTSGFYTYRVGTCIATKEYFRDYTIRFIAIPEWKSYKLTYTMGDATVSAIEDKIG